MKLSLRQLFLWLLYTEGFFTRMIVIFMERFWFSSYSFCQRTRIMLRFNKVVYASIFIFVSSKVILHTWNTAYMASVELLWWGCKTFSSMQDEPKKNKFYGKQWAQSWLDYLFSSWIWNRYRATKSASHKRLNVMSRKMLKNVKR